MVRKPPRETTELIPGWRVFPTNTHHAFPKTAETRRLLEAISCTEMPRTRDLSMKGDDV